MFRPAGDLGSFAGVFGAAASGCSFLSPSVRVGAPGVMEWLGVGGWEEVKAEA